MHTTFEKKLMPLKKIEGCAYHTTADNVSYMCIFTHREKYLSWGGVMIYPVHKQIQRKTLNM